MTDVVPAGEAGGAGGGGGPPPPPPPRRREGRGPPRVEAGGCGGVVPLKLRGGGKSPGSIDEDPDPDTCGRGLFGSLEHAVADGHLLGVHLLDARVRIGGPGVQGGLQRIFRNISHRMGWLTLMLRNGVRAVLETGKIERSGTTETSMPGVFSDFSGPRRAGRGSPGSAASRPRRSGRPAPRKRANP